MSLTGLGCVKTRRKQIGADQVAALMELRGVPFRAIDSRIGHPFAHVSTAAVLRDELGNAVATIATASRALNVQPPERASVR
jgi:hypothetical protein